MTELVTVNCPLMRTGAGELVVQTADEPRFVADCKVNPASLVGHVNMTLVPAAVMASWGAPTDGSEMLNIVPEPKTPPFWAVP